MRRFFNEKMVNSEGHVSIMDGKRAVELPIVDGVVGIPDELAKNVVLSPDWVPYNQQVPINDEKLSPIRNMNKHYSKKEEDKE